MTENEAIKILEKFQLQIEHSIAEEDCCEYNHSEKILQEDKGFLNAFNIAIAALKEIQEYRKLGTVEELTTANRYIRLAKKHGTTGEMIDKCMTYEEIGTVEECRESAEKQKAKKPPVIGADFMVGRDDNGNSIWEHDYVCSECGMGIAEEYICCPYCGTYINWSEVTGNE